MEDTSKGKNVFFELGVKEIKKMVPGFFKDNKRGLSFIYFHDVLIKKLLNQEIINKKHKRVVIVSTQRMMPLALYYYRNYWNVVAVIDATSSIQRVLQVIESYYFNTLKFTTDKDSYSDLSQYEYMILKLMLNGNDIIKVIDELNIDRKQYYNYSRMISKKMGVKRLYHLNISH